VLVPRDLYAHYLGNMSPLDQWSRVPMVHNDVIACAA